MDGEVPSENLDNLKKESSLENAEQQSTHGGRREGSGRPKGSENAETKERNAVLKAMKERIAKNADRLLDAAMTLALGTSYLYVIRKDEKGKRQKAELITSAITIKEYLDGELDGLQDEYYFITTEKPDITAIRELYDRAFGKPDLPIKGTLDINFNEVIEGLDDKFDPDELEQDQV